MRPALLSQSSDGLPSNLRRGVAGTVGLHAAVAAALLLAMVLAAPRLPPASVMPVTVGLTVVEAAPPPPVLVRTGPTLDSVDTSPPAAVFSTAGGFTFDTSKIRAHRNILFPFLTGELTFLNELRQSAEADRRRLHNPLGTGGRRRGSAPPLAMSAAARNALIDRAWSRRDRWKSLGPIVDLTTRFDGHDGDLPKILRGHVERNLLQPYNESVPADPRFWTVLGLAADHVDVVEFVGRYVREHPSSRTTTELLFLLDELTQASANAWDILMDTNVDNLALTRDASPGNAALARQLQRGYQQWARDHAADTPQARDARYDGVRMALLTTIIETSPNGYGAADARFLAGRLLWDRDDLAGAVRMWREMGDDERQVYAEARAGIRRALPPGGNVDVLAIVGVFGAERGRWLRESADRLARFGYTPVTF
jgi:hypothetical protein